VRRADRDDELGRAIRTRRGRRASRDEGERSLAQNLAMIGVLGWTIVLPGLLGVAIGRWIDGALGGGIVFTAALLFAGIAAGSALAWRRLHA